MGNFFALLETNISYFVLEYLYGDREKKADLVQKKVVRIWVVSVYLARLGYYRLLGSPFLSGYNFFC
jgi:hypothetical protein